MVKNKYKITGTIKSFEIPHRDEFHIKEELKNIEKRLDKVFEFPISKESLYLSYRIMDDKKLDNYGYFIHSKLGKSTFSVFDEKGYYRQPRLGCKVVDITVLSNKGEDIVIGQFQVNKSKVKKFCKEFDSYIKYYSLLNNKDVKLEVE